MCDEIILPTEHVICFKNKYIYHQRCFYCIPCRIPFKKGDFVGITHPKQILCYEHYNIAAQQPFCDQVSTLENLCSNENSFDSSGNGSLNLETLIDQRCDNSIQCQLYQDMSNSNLAYSCQQMGQSCKGITRLESKYVTRLSGPLNDELFAINSDVNKQIVSQSDGPADSFTKHGPADSFTK